LLDAEEIMSETAAASDAARFTIHTQRRAGQAFEVFMHFVFLACGLTAVASVAFICVHVAASGWPIIAKEGLAFLIGKTWNPGSSQFGVLPMIAASVFATAGAIAVALPAGVLTAVFLAKIAPDKAASILRAFVDLLAGIPSVVYGLLGAILIAPRIFKLQTAAGLPAGGSLLAASIMLAIMILPTIISVSETALRAVPKQYEDAALALGATKLQCVFKTSIPAAKSGIAAGMALGIGRAAGEAMAVMMVAGNAAIMPSILRPARLLTASIPIEWAYSSGTHREALYGIGLVLFVFIMILNIAVRRIMKKGAEQNG
jgi:phosphate transport system permease protein